MDVLVSPCDKTLAYDENGNTISETQTSTSALLKSYVYNQEDRLTQIKNGVGDSIASYDYDPLGRRLKKTIGEITTYYLYADEGLVAEFDVSGDQQQAYGYVPGSPWGTNPLYTKIGTDYAFYHTDHLGTPQMLTSISGAKVWEGSADAFGQMTVTTQTITNNLRFPGQYYDQESGQHYNYFRNYDPTTGRYIQSDLIGLAGGLVTYGYVGSNPLKFIDSKGLIFNDYYAAEDVLKEFASNFDDFILPPKYIYGINPLSEALGSMGNTQYIWAGSEVRITDMYFERCISLAEAWGLLNVYIHETLHYNQSLYDNILQYFFQDDQIKNSGDGLGDEVHDLVYSMADFYTDILFTRYDFLRKNMDDEYKESGCECEK